MSEILLPREPEEPEELKKSRKRRGKRKAGREKEPPDGGFFFGEETQKEPGIAVQRSTETEELPDLNLPDEEPVAPTKKRRARPAEAREEAPLSGEEESFSYRRPEELFAGEDPGTPKETPDGTQAGPSSDRRERTPSGEGKFPTDRWKTPTDKKTEVASSGVLYSEEAFAPDGGEESGGGDFSSDSSAPEEPDGEETPQKSGFVRACSWIYDWVEVFALSMAIVFFLFAFVARVAVVEGDSMNETLHDKDKLLVSEFLYTPKQGDIVVCQSEFFGYDQPLVKRVIATAGQTVRLDTENWKVYVDGVPLEEDYVNLRPGVGMTGWSYGEEYVVPEGHVFVMGDNRNISWDSRDSRIGPIDTRYVVGKVVFRFLPLRDFGAVK